MPKTVGSAKNAAPKPANVVPLRLVPRQTPSMPALSRNAQQTVRALRGLLDQALAGQLEGLAWVAVHQLRNYETYVVGECADSPTFTKGAVSVLVDRLGQHIVFNEPLPIG